MTLKRVILDLDDTLLDCGVHYDNAKEKFVQWSSERTGIPKSAISKILGDIDLTCVTLPVGFNRIRFPRSFAATSVALDVISGNPVDEAAANDAFLLGDEVFRAPYLIYDHVPKFIDSIKKLGLRVYICTKGDVDVQNSKIERNNLRSMVDDVFIVPFKSPETYQEILHTNTWVPQETMMFGDSLRDDVEAAIQAGMRACHYSGTKRPHWAYDRTETTVRYHVAQTHDDFIDLLYKDVFEEWE